MPNMEEFRPIGEIILSEGAISKLPMIFYDMHQQNDQPQGISDCSWSMHDISRLKYGPTFPITHVINVFEGSGIPHEHTVFQEISESIPEQ